MASGGNPLFRNNKTFGGAGAGQMSAPAQSTMTSEQLQSMYDGPSASPAQTGRMTFDDVIIKTAGTLAMVLAGAVVGWMVPILLWPGLIVGLVLGLVNSFKREPSPALILLYAAFEGMFLGAISGMLEQMFDGIVVQAVIGTFSVFAVTLLLFKSGKVRATPKMTKIAMIAMMGYALFSLINLGLVMFGAVSNPWGVRGMEIPGTNIPFGLVLGLLAVALAAYCLVMDFTGIANGVRNGVARKYAWTAAFGLTVTLVWLYVEILRLIAIMRGSD